MVGLVVLVISLDKDSLALAAYYNIIFVAVALPVVVFFGFAVWRKRYGGNLTRPFMMKVISGAVIFVVAIGIIAWRYYDPDGADESSSFRWLFLLVHLIMLGAATVAGHQGASLSIRAVYVIAHEKWGWPSKAIDNQSQLHRLHVQLARYKRGEQTPRR